jgi:transposase
MRWWKPASSSPIHPNLVKACRPRYRAVAAESDPGDAFILADILRTDGHRLRPLAPQSDAIKALRGLVRGRDDLVRTRVALANQLTGLLESFWPGAARIFTDPASPIALAFLERYPTPDAAARLGPKRLAGFLAQHRYCGRRAPEALLERLRNAPDGGAGEAEGEFVRALARALQALIAELAKLAELPDGRIVMSFPRAGRVCAAQILAELGDVLTRFPSRDQLAAEAGFAPVTYQSGESRGVGWCWACNKRLRAALTRMPTTPATRAPGPPTSTSAPARAAATTPTPSAAWPAPGPASSGAPGSVASLTTPPNTPLPRPS